MTRRIAQLIQVSAHHAEQWHQAGLDLFEYNVRLEGAEQHVVKLLYHNYQIWHFIELYKSPDSGTVLFVYDGGIKHNTLRNECIEALDLCLCADQKGEGKVNSETIGSILDRIGILQIKALHLKDKTDSRLALVERQLKTLEDCAEELMEDMLAGKRRCELFSRFKVEYSGQ
jgi:hypothetical protein